MPPTNGDDDNPPKCTQQNSKSMRNNNSSSNHGNGQIGSSSLHHHQSSSSHRQRNNDVPTVAGTPGLSSASSHASFGGTCGAINETSSTAAAAAATTTTTIASSSRRHQKLLNRSSHHQLSSSSHHSHNSFGSTSTHQPLLINSRSSSHHRFPFPIHEKNTIGNNSNKNSHRNFRNIFSVCFVAASFVLLAMVQFQTYFFDDLSLSAPILTNLDTRENDDKSSSSTTASATVTQIQEETQEDNQNTVPIAAATPVLDTDEEATNAIAQDEESNKAGQMSTTNAVETSKTQQDPSNTTAVETSAASEKKNASTMKTIPSSSDPTDNTTVVDEKRDSSGPTNSTTLMTSSEEEQPPQTSLLPWSNLTTLTFKEGYLYSGFRNQLQVFTILVMEAVRGGFGQILVESISMKDLHGSNKQVPFHNLWDVEHWNSYHPRLPRLVLSDPILHPHFNPKKRTPFTKTKEGNWTDVNGNVIIGHPTKPVYHGLQSKLMRQYWGYSKGKEPYAMPDGTPNPVDLLILGGALRPHKDLQALVDAKLESMRVEMEQLIKSTTTTSNSTDGETTTISTAGSNKRPMEYMALHARIEADMQMHRVCRDKKVLNLTDIISMLEDQFPEPPAKALFLPINRKILEKEGYPNEKEPEKTNWIAVKNLQSFNDIIEHGLWNGTVKVFQMGTTGLEGTKFENRSSVAGSLLDYYIALESKIFIGTPVSSFSHALIQTRFYRQEYNNWQYLPEGLSLWTPISSDDDESPSIDAAQDSKKSKRRKKKNDGPPKKAPPFDC